MWEAITSLISNLGVSFEVAITLILTLGCMIFFAKDFKLGILMMLFTNAGLFMWFYAASMDNWGLPLGLVFMFIIILSFTLYAINKTGQRVGVI
jgi:hypothetical protein